MAPDESNASIPAEATAPDKGGVATAPTFPNPVTDETPVFQIGRLSIKPGDVLVIRLEHVPHVERFAQIRDAFHYHFPNTPMMMIDKSIDLTVLTREEIEARVSVASGAAASTEESQA